MARKDEKDGDGSEVSQSALYRVSGFLKGLFVAMGCDPAGLYSLSDARRVLQEYIKERDLVCAENPQNVVGIGDYSDWKRLDEVLMDAIYRDKKEPENGFPTELSRAELVKLFTERLLPYHCVSVNDKVVVKKGKCQKIEIVTQKMKGQHRELTLVYNTSDFMVNTKELIKELAKACASR